MYVVYRQDIQSNIACVNTSCLWALPSEDFPSPRHTCYGATRPITISLACVQKQWWCRGLWSLLVAIWIYFYCGCIMRGMARGGLHLGYANPCSSFEVMTINMYLTPLQSALFPVRSSHQVGRDKNDGHIFKKTKYTFHDVRILKKSATSSFYPLKSSPFIWL